MLGNDSLTEKMELTTKRKRIMIYFIEAAEKLIRIDGVDGLSIRKIAGEAGYNSATMYNYFNDLEHLALFGSVCYLREYVVKLSKQLRPDMTFLAQYRIIYQCFNDVAFRSPDIFHNMFFGKYSYKLENVLHVYYYELFPAELEGLSQELRMMLVAGSMHERDRYIMRGMVEEGAVSEDKAEMTLELITALHQNYIYEASIQGENLNTDKHKEKFENVFEYILSMAH